MFLLQLQRSLTIEVAATSPTVTQVIAYQGEETTTKVVAAVLKLFNDGLNTSLQMTPRQLFEYAMIWIESFPNETVKDLILCMKRVKAGRYGPIFNRVDGTVVSDFFRKYLLEKAEWGEAENKKYVSEQVKKGLPVLSILDDKQKRAIEMLTLKGKALKTPEITPLSSDRHYSDYLAKNAEDIEFEILEDVEKRAKAQNIPEVLEIVVAEKNRRIQKANEEFKDYEERYQTYPKLP
ncbi:hypothetical protein GCM10028808_73500 [Spirosoma migulaei]